MSGFEYGNTRLRARYAERLDRADLATLLAAGGLDQMLGSLTATVYSDDVEAAVARYRGLRRLDEAIRRHLTRAVSDTLSFYTGDERDALDLVEERWDVRTLTALLRAQASQRGAADLAGWLVPAGRIDAAALDELAAQPGVRAMVDLVVAWRLPDRETSHALRNAMVEFETGGETVVLESALVRAHARRVEEAFRLRPDDELVSVLHAELVATAVATALRLRAGRLSGEMLPDPAAAVITGTIPLDTVEYVVALEQVEEVAAALMARPLPPGFDAAVTVWVRHGDVARLRDDLDSAVTDLAARLFRRDPLGMGVPVGYLWIKEQEARNLRLIGRAHVHGLDPADVEERLVVA